MIQETLPEARFIHIVRDGRDVRIAQIDLVGPQQHRGGGGFWAKEVQNTRASFADLAYYMEIRYEDLLRETEASLRKSAPFSICPGRLHAELPRAVRATAGGIQRLRHGQRARISPMPGATSRP